MKEEGEVFPTEMPAKVVLKLAELDASHVGHVYWQSLVTFCWYRLG